MKKSEPDLQEPAWNQAELLERVDNDRELLRELLTIFKEDFPRTICSLEAAVSSGDLKRSGLLSHTLKGMLLNLGGARAAAAAARLEELATAGEIAALKGALDALECEAGKLLPELDAYMTEVRH
ncbi:MAG TPA: Hpt domain-containing protein [Candidatus Acidoferrum sp.]|nr:Hpt domain-containing protein [Candidatus Acidoferrum sp.]